MLEIKNLHVSVEGKKIIKGLDLTIKQGDVHALMGPNGSGKSTLAYALMGHPRYVVGGGKVTVEGRDIVGLKPEERAKLGLFLGFQYPQEVSGVSTVNLLRTAWRKNHPNEDLANFSKALMEAMNTLGVSKDFVNRSLNEGFSGGEKKRSEVLQMLVLSPKFAVLDETDSGLDIDALKDVSKAINTLRAMTGFLLVTHYKRILDHVKPDFVHVMLGGRVVKSGGPELAEELERQGYAETAQSIKGSKSRNKV